ncbi:hypothetical protein Tsubulata_047641 [Turnera subulata]|uniref:Endonuclease/exonuclease/phosphatase domain-containing protein n=1 Tax=Turnera subulata TaxID=218843 RepID=A0A9Q0GA75_9ROSI|nr:hypothetical protein Tsubulata_047641 [Turnera subulata]
MLSAFYRTHKPELVVIVSPRVSGIRADQIISRLPFSSSHRVEARGFAGALADQIREPWLLAGDFNAVLDGSDRKDRFGRPDISSKAFQECVHSASLVDLGFVGGRFTWKGGGYHARLDRFFCNDGWRVLFPEASVFHMPFTCSDHRPILLKQGSQPPPHE